MKEKLVLIFKNKGDIQSCVTSADELYNDVMGKSRGRWTKDTSEDDKKRVQTQYLL